MISTLVIINIILLCLGGPWELACLLTLFGALNHSCNVLGRDE